MKTIKLTSTAKKLGISISFLCQILQGDRRPSWKMAKYLASKTKTKPELWMDGEPSLIETILKNLNF